MDWYLVQIVRDNKLNHITIRSVYFLFDSLAETDWRLSLPDVVRELMRNYLSNFNLSTLRDLWAPGVAFSV